jgi:hypothetical protein
MDAKARRVQHAERRVGERQNRLHVKVVFHDLAQKPLNASAAQAHARESATRPKRVKPVRCSFFRRRRIHAASNAEPRTEIPRRDAISAKK